MLLWYKIEVSVGSNYVHVLLPAFELDSAEMEKDKWKQGGPWGSCTERHRWSTAGKKITFTPELLKENVSLKPSQTRDGRRALKPGALHREELPVTLNGPAKITYLQSSITVQILGKSCPLCFLGPDNSTKTNTLSHTHTHTKDWHTNLCNRQQDNTIKQTANICLLIFASVWTQKWSLEHVSVNLEVVWKKPLLPHF